MVFINASLIASHIITILCIPMQAAYSKPINIGKPTIKRWGSLGKRQGINHKIGVLCFILLYCKACILWFFLLFWLSSFLFCFCWYFKQQILFCNFYSCCWNICPAFFNFCCCFCFFHIDLHMSLAQLRKFTLLPVLYHTL